MAAKLHFSLVSPERELFSGAVDQVDAPGSEGDFGVLAGHAPFMTALKEGPVRVHNDGQVTVYEVRGGFADVTPEGLTILAEHAGPPRGLRPRGGGPRGRPMRPSRLPLRLRKSRRRRPRCPPPASAPRRS